MGDWLIDALRLWAQVRGHYIRTERGVELYCYKDTATWDRRHAQKTSFALGEIIMFRSMEDFTPRNLRHELKHCDQIRDRGGLVRFLPGYYYETVKAWLFTGDTDNNPFEQEAIRAEDE
ncbi:MAG: hypothetical protein DRP83_00100 [Planctomycetota bacterium]|nr:MAG: hypothetical protein DRP83_00100 [Planctomycetota bacterium]